MEILLFFGAVGLFLMIVGIKDVRDAKQREREFIEALYKDYGKELEKEYALERFVRISSYYEKHREQQKGFLDDITWNDLNMDDIFKRMNYTYSASGEEYLYYTLRNVGKTKEELTHFEELVAYFIEHKDERVQIQFLMKQLGYTGKFSLYDYLDNLDYLGERSNKRHILLNLLFIPFLLLALYDISLSLTGVVVLIIYNIVTYFKEKNEIEPYITSFAYVMRLLVTCDKLVSIKVTACEEEWEQLRRHKQRLKELKRGAFWVFSINQGIGSGNPLDMLMDYIRMCFHVDLIQFNKMLQQVRKHMEDIDALITLVGYIESVIAVGAFRKSLPLYCIPELLEEGMKEEGEAARKKIHLADAYHPLIRDVVRNSITAKRGVLLTGSNASGKSTFLKTVALNAIFAQTIHTCTAAEYRAPFYEIYSSMSLRDSISTGESYYIVEIKALKRILDAAKNTSDRVLCFVDEVLRGTNTVERIAASTQILKSLSIDNILCFAATHDIELTELLKDYYDNYHFEEDIQEGDVLFNYKLQEGKATTRNAIKLLEIMGYDAAIIEKANEQARHFVATNVWK
ncbi:MAG: hypothetical protein IJF07_05390 [Lachnospiraceae bacterium]|nr:hypothetical protein [Lachnospiraceae bacterium]